MIPKTPDTQPNKKLAKLGAKNKTNFKNGSTLKTARSSPCSLQPRPQRRRPPLPADFHSELSEGNFCCRAPKLA